MSNLHLVISQCPSLSLSTVLLPFLVIADFAALGFSVSFIQTVSQGDAYSFYTSVFKIMGWQVITGMRLLISIFFELFLKYTSKLGVAEKEGASANLPPPIPPLPQPLNQNQASYTPPNPTPLIIQTHQRIASNPSTHSQPTSATPRSPESRSQARDRMLLALSTTPFAAGGFDAAPMSPRSPAPRSPAPRSPQSPRETNQRGKNQDTEKTLQNPSLLPPRNII